MTKTKLISLVILIVVMIILGIRLTQLEPKEKDVLEGHSTHGPEFNNGPRQRTKLWEEYNKNVTFPITTTSPLAQKYFNQGIRQLHGFAYLEAERSFREVLALDTNCAMAYWGIAMACTGYNHYNDIPRATTFINKAHLIRDHLSTIEKQLILATYNYLNFYTDKDEADQRIQYAKNLDYISQEHPQDPNLFGLYVVQTWINKSHAIPITNHEEIETRFSGYFKKHPNHPIHHYRIHLWDGKNPIRALSSLQKNGPASPDIAHMWHMPGHIYSKLHENEKTAWYQEASARTDHAYMKAFQILPDQVHNYTHNNEWLSKTFVKLGRVHEAIAVAKNMIEIPQHPKYNNVKDPYSSSFLGRRNLIAILSDHERWEELITLYNQGYFNIPNLPHFQHETLFMIGKAYYYLNQTKEGQVIQKQLTQLRVNTKSLKERKQISHYLKLLSGYHNISLKKTEEAFRILQKHAKGIERARLLLQNKKPKESLSLINKNLKKNPHSLLLLSYKIIAAVQTNQLQDALKAKQVYLEQSKHADKDIITYKRIERFLDDNEKKEKKDSFNPSEKYEDHPQLRELGPLKWTYPYTPKHNVKELDQITDKSRATLLVFFLGKECFHCVEQLTQIKDQKKEFKELGINIVAIDSQGKSRLKPSKANTFPFTMIKDPQHTLFKAYRCYDDFENMPLHGTFLVQKNQILWQDINYTPFEDISFLLRESKRLLDLKRG